MQFARTITAAALGLALAAPGFPQAFEVDAKARSLFRRALDENRAGNYGTAFDYFLKAQQEDPDVLAMDDEDLLSNVENFLEDELNQDDSDINAHFQLAELKMLQGLQVDALPHYNRVVQLAPGSPLAVKAKPLIADIKNQLKAASLGSVGGGGSAPGGSPGGGSSNAQVSGLQNQLDQMRQQLQDTQQELARVRQELAQQKGKPDRSNDFDRLKKEFDEYKVQAEEWRRYYVLYFQALSRGQVTVPR